MKIFMDRGILTGTAYLRESWGQKAQKVYDIKQPEYRGVINYTHQDLVNVISAACETEWTITAHCTGGGGVDMLLDTFEEVNKTYKVKSLRASIIHGNFFTKEAMERMQKLGIIANVQAPWFYKDADAMNYILGEERIKSFNPYHSMIKSGVHLSGGSFRFTPYKYSNITHCCRDVGMWVIPLGLSIYPHPKGGLKGGF
jgi:predicted amidohydrolase YtcJ